MATTAAINSSSNDWWALNMAVVLVQLEFLVIVIIIWYIQKKNVDEKA